MPARFRFRYTTSKHPPTLELPPAPGVLPAFVGRFANAGEDSLLRDDEKGIGRGEGGRRMLGPLRLVAVGRHACSVHHVYLPLLHLPRGVGVVVEVAVTFQDEPSSLPALYRLPCRRQGVESFTVSKKQFPTYRTCGRSRSSLHQP